MSETRRSFSKHFAAFLKKEKDLTSDGQPACKQEDVP